MPATLFAQVALTQLELDRVKRRVVALETAQPGLHARFQRRVDPALERCAGGLAALVLGAVSDRTAWQEYAELRASADEVLAEAHDFIQGALVRGAELDDGLCELADRMLDGLSAACGIPWGSLAVPADADFISDLAQVIRLRAGDVSLWHLPVAVHEFGHFVGPRIERAGVAPFLALLAAYRVRSQAWSHAHELFADAFATYAAGPAFPAACIVSRFPPTSADEGTTSHPAHETRVELMLALLDRLDERHPGDYATVTSYLRATWRMNRRTSGGGGQPPAGGGPAQEALDRYLPILDEHLGAARYGRLDRARDAEEGILQGRRSAAGRLRILDVLNGLWLSRIDRPVDDAHSLQARGATAFALAAGLAS